MLPSWMSAEPTQLAEGRVRRSLVCILLLTLSLVTSFLFSHTSLLSAQTDSSVSTLPEQGEGTAPVRQQETSAPSLPPLPEGVTDLKFREFFTLPIGPRGLTITKKLQSLNGKQVRILGYMAKQGEPYPGFFLLTPLPMRLHEHEYGHADDLPPTVAFVHLPQYKDIIVPYMAGPLLLIGTLSVGTQEERDGRISLVRLILDTVPQAMAHRIEHATRNAPSQPGHDH